MVLSGVSRCVCYVDGDAVPLAVARIACLSSNAGAHLVFGRSIAQSPTVLSTLMEERERVRRDSSDEEDEVPIGGSRRPTATSMHSLEDPDRLRLDSVGDALPPAHPRTARLSSGTFLPSFRCVSAVSCP